MVQTRTGVLVWLENVNDRSNTFKFWSLLWSGQELWTSYGRIGSPGVSEVYRADDPVETAQRAWQLLRAKTGPRKGYSVIAADPRFQFEVDGSGYRSRDAVMRQARSHAVRCLVRPIPALEALAGRTPSAGHALLPVLASPSPDAGVLVESVLAPEPFVRALALNHPLLPEEGRVAAYLLGQAS